MKRGADKLYGWMQRNPATVALVALGIGAIATIAVFLVFLQVEDTRKLLNPRTEPLENPCIAHQRVEGTRGRNCPQFYVPHDSKGVVRQNPSTAGQPSTPGQPGDTGGVEPPKEGSGSPAEPHDPASQEQTPPPTPAAVEDPGPPLEASGVPEQGATTPAAEAPAPGLLTPTLETAGETVEAVCSSADRVLNLC